MKELKEIFHDHQLMINFTLKKKFRTYTLALFHQEMKLQVR